MTIAWIEKWAWIARATWVALLAVVAARWGYAALIVAVFASFAMATAGISAVSAEIARTATGGCERCRVLFALNVIRGTARHRDEEAGN